MTKSLALIAVTAFGPNLPKSKATTGGVEYATERQHAVRILIRLQIPDQHTVRRIRRDNAQVTIKAITDTMLTLALTGTDIDATVEALKYAITLKSKKLALAEIVKYVASCYTVVKASQP